MSRNCRHEAPCTATAAFHCWSPVGVAHIRFMHLNQVFSIKLHPRATNLSH